MNTYISREEVSGDTEGMRMDEYEDYEEVYVDSNDDDDGKDPGEQGFIDGYETEEEPEQEFSEDEEF